MATKPPWMRHQNRKQRRKQEALIRQWQKLAEEARVRNTRTPESAPDRPGESDDTRSESLRRIAETHGGPYTPEDF